MATTPSRTIASELADWVSALRFEDLPADIIALAKECFRDAIACAVIGSTRPRVKRFEAAIHPSSKGEATVILADWRTNVAEAAYINAIYIQGCELDDSFVGGGGHPSSVTVPVALAIAEAHHLSGSDLIRSIVAGYETLYRTSAPINPQFVTRGFQGTGLLGPFAAVATAATLLGLPSAVIAQAFAIAGCSCTGLTEYALSGGETKRLYAGQSVRAGIDAVNLAQAGIDGPLTIFEGERGVYSGFADSSDPSLATQGLGTDLRIARHKIKPYPTVSTAHGAIAATAMVCDPPIKATQIERVTVKIHESRLKHGGTIQVPWDFLSAQFSISFSVALRILFGRNDIDLYEDPTIRSNTDVIDLCNKIRILSFSAEDIASKVGAQLALESAIVTIDVIGEPPRTHVQIAAPGTPKNPMTSTQVRQKFLDLTRDAFDDRTQLRLDEIINELDTLQSLDGLFALLRSPSSKGPSPERA